MQMTDSNAGSQWTGFQGCFAPNNEYPFPGIDARDDRRGEIKKRRAKETHEPTCSGGSLGHVCRLYIYRPTDVLLLIYQRSAWGFSW